MTTYSYGGHHGQLVVYILTHLHISHIGTSELCYAELRLSLSHAEKNYAYALDGNN